MMLKRKITTLAYSLLVAFPFVVMADEGMFPMSELEKLDLKARGIELNAAQLFNASQLSLVDGVCRVNGCTGSFVSSQGLIITNHHCAYDAIQKASTKERDLLTDGFNARSLAEEISAPDYQVRVTEDYFDVSKEVLAAASGGMTSIERKKAIEKRSKELESQAEKERPGFRAEVSEMFAGKTYVLFIYTYLRDVRLVFAPPQSVGNFGGEVDNWEWPRHTGDFSFMRAYVAPDGKSATYAKENVPYKPKRVIRVAPEGVNENDVVFLLGYPGRTARHKTASFLDFEQHVRLPSIVESYQWQIDVMTKAGKEDRAVEIKHASRIRSLANVEKRSRGQLKGLTRANIAATRAKEEEQLQSFIDRDPERSRKYGKVLGEIQSVYTEMKSAAPLELNLDQLRSAVRAFSAGFFIVDAAMERTKPNLERETAFTDRNFPESVQKLKTAMSDFHAPTDIIMLDGTLNRLQKIETAKAILPLANLIRDPAKIETKADQLINQTRLGEVEFIEECLQKNADELKQAQDPLLQLAIQLYPTYLEMRNRDKAREGKLGQLYGALVDVKQQFLATQFIPDANGTLRLTSGRVRAYSPEDAIVKTPISTLKGVIEKTTGVEPFITPKAVLDKYQAGEFGSFRNAQLNDVPVAILYDTDTTGGNSGSPVFNKRGELVGVNFDRCFEATINDFAWNTNYSRSIGVDIRYVLWITGIVYGANHLLSEMGVK
jgi:Peptidase S46